MSYFSKMLPVMLTVWSVAAQAQTTPYSATVAEDPTTGAYIKTNVVVAPALLESHFGDKGQLVLGGSTNANLSGSHQQALEVVDAESTTITLNGPDALTLNVGTMASAFVAKDFLLGMQGAIGGAFNKGANKSLHTQVGPLAGYNVRMNDNASFLPTLAVLYDYSQTWFATDADTHNHNIGVEVGLNFSFNIIRHLNVLVGPYVSQSVYSHTNTRVGEIDRGAEGKLATNYGLRASLLGWR